MVVRFLLVGFALTLPAVAQNNFTILSHGKPAGKASYSFDKTKNGYKIKGKVNYHLSASAGTLDPVDPDPKTPRSLKASSIPGDRQFIQEYNLDANGTYDGGFITDMASQLNTGFTPNKSRDKLDVILSSAGQQQLKDPIAIKPNFVFLPNYDPSALQSVLLRATQHPTEKDLYLVVVPGGGRSDDEPVPAVWLTNQPEAHGTLDGKPLALHHYVLRLYKSEYDIFADETNTLMMGTSSTLSAIYLRDGFVLTSVK
jgi:hypothetical protein